MFDTIIHLFHVGGLPVMTGIAFTLLVSLVIVIERSYRFLVEYDLSNSSAFMAAVQKMVMNNSIENAIRLCKKARPKVVPYIISEGLKRANDSQDEQHNAIEYATLQVLPKVSKGVPMLATTANVSTLLGLLGTIFGLMKSFGAAAKATGAAKQTILAEGISEALTATSFGLGTALFCLFFYGVLLMKQKAITDDMALSAAKLTDLLYTRKVKIKSKEATN